MRGCIRNSQPLAPAMPGAEMESERWRRLQDLFIAARALSANEREHLLAEYAGTDSALVDDVRSLLAADSGAGILDAPPSQVTSVATLLEDRQPGHVGAYRIVRELGRGGMGIVYLADRADGQFEQRVAIKLIESRDADDPLHRRFLAERQILATLKHPNIGRLLDGGVTEEGRPYLVMEYVDGLPITKYCDDRRLDVRARLLLFSDVCAAVQHAHQNLVIHRDLKPSNILVSSDGCVHLLDFGIAKLITPALAPAPMPVTRFDSRMMTPEYASPEQVRGESLTTASDIYSLGVLLYELLCGRRPYELTTGSPVEIATAVCEQDPAPPSLRVQRTDHVDTIETPEEAARLRDTTVERLASLLSDDLDAIVLMAMRKEPDRRYASADMLRQDIGRHLSAVPVLAHRDSRRYRFGKFLRRHRVEMSAAALVVLALVIGLSVAIVQGRRASSERDRAERALAESNGVTGFLMDLFQAGDAGTVAQADLTALELLRRGALRADELADQPLVYARLLDVIGEMSLNLGQLDEAQRRHEQALAIHRSSGQTLALASSLIHLARVHRTRGDPIRARSLVTEALGLRRAALPADHPDVAEALYELGWVSYGREQEALYRQAVAALLDAPVAAEQRVRLLQALSTNLRRQGRLADAVAADREALAVAERSFGPEHHATGYAMIHLADHIYDIEQDAATAERLYRRGIELIERQLGGASVRLIHGLNSLAKLLGDRGDGDAESVSRRALAISRSASGPDHPRNADQLHRLAYELQRRRRFAEAEQTAREALDFTTRMFGPNHQAVTSARLPLLADIYDRQRRYEEADDTYRQAFDRAARPSNVVIGQMHRDYGRMLIGRSDLARAEEQLLQSLDLLNQAYPDGHPNVDETKRALMDLYVRMDRPDAVERYRVPPGRFIPY